MTRNMFLGTDLKPILQAPNQACAVRRRSRPAGRRCRRTTSRRGRRRWPARSPPTSPTSSVCRRRWCSRPTRRLTGRPRTPRRLSTTSSQLLVDELAQRGLEYEAGLGVQRHRRGAAVGLAADAGRAAARPRRRARPPRRPRPATSSRCRTRSSGRYAAALTVPTVAGPLTQPRGWASVDVTMQRPLVPLRHDAPRGVLVADPQRPGDRARLDRRRIAVAGRARRRLQLRPGHRHRRLRRAGGGGFADAWTEPDGLTCCHAVDLHDPDPTLTKRVDLVLTEARSRRGRSRSSASARTTARTKACGPPTTPGWSRSSGSDS